MITVVFDMFVYLFVERSCPCKVADIVYTKKIKEKKERGGGGYFFKPRSFMDGLLNFSVQSIK
jgi:hypothetical protein